jgi:membrane protease subunit HflK
LDDVVKNDGNDGPWGGREDAGSGSPPHGDGQRQPWGQPRRRRPDRPPVGPPAIEALLRKSRERFGGRLPEPAGRPLWLWFTAIFIVAWLLWTSVHQIGPQERGVVTRFGRYAETLDPGIHLTFPRPIDSVRKLSVEEQPQIDSGERADNAMLTADRNIVDVAYSVRWKIRDPEAYAYGLADPRATLDALARSVMRGEVARASLDRMLGPASERDAVAESARERMQELLESYRAGVVIIEVSIRRADPPKQVSDAYDKVASAQKDAQDLITKARSDAFAAQAVAQGDAADFDAVYEQYRLAPEVTRDRLYFDTMDDLMANNNKVIVTAKGVTLPPPSDLRRKPPAVPGQDPIIVEGKPR